MKFSFYFWCYYGTKMFESDLEYDLCRMLKQSYNIVCERVDYFWIRVIDWRFMEKPCYYRGEIRNRLAWSDIDFIHVRHKNIDYRFDITYIRGYLSHN